MNLKLSELEWIELDAIQNALATIVPLSSEAWDLRRKVERRMRQVEAERQRRLGRP